MLLFKEITAKSQFYRGFKDMDLESVIRHGEERKFYRD